MRSKFWLGGLVACCLVSGGAGMRPAIANPLSPFPASLLAQVQSPASRPASSPASSPESSQLTEANIRKVLAFMQSAQNQENLADLLKHVAPFVSSEITITGENGSTTVILDGIEKHRMLLKDLFSRIKTREVLSQDVNVRLSDDGNVGIATIYTVKAVTTEEGQSFIASDIDTLRFAWLNNQPTLISFQSKGWFSEAPASK